MKKSIQLILLSIALLGTACGDETTEPIKGSLQVFVRLIDEKGNEINDRSNVKVTLGDELVAYSDATGKAEFKDLPVGTYDILAEKEGFDIAKNFNVNVVGGQVPAVVSSVALFQYPSLELETIDAELRSNGVRINGVLKKEVEFLHLLYYISTDSQVSNGNYQKMVDGYTSCCASMESFGITIGFDNSFKTGQTVYIAVYARSEANGANYHVYYYYDYDFNKDIYPGEKRLTDSPLKALVY